MVHNTLSTPTGGWPATFVYCPMSLDQFPSTQITQLSHLRERPPLTRSHHSGPRADCTNNTIARLVGTGPGQGNITLINVTFLITGAYTNNTIPQHIDRLVRTSPGQGNITLIHVPFLISTTVTHHADIIPRYTIMPAFLEAGAAARFPFP